MKFRVVFIFFSLATQLEASVLQKETGSPSELDETPVEQKRTLAKEYDQHEEISGIKNSRRHIRNDAPTANPDNKVLALGLDTGAPADNKNVIVQAISDAFGGLLERPSVRSHGKSYRSSDEKKPLALELKSESILQSLEKFLSSPRVKKIANDLARKAAIIYRAIEKEL